MITDVVFDLDDTLCDFQTAKMKGLEAAIGLLPHENRQQAVILWKRCEADLYALFATGTIDREEYRYQRFAVLVPSKNDEEATVQAMNKAFMFEVNDNIALMDGAVECLEELHSMGLRCHLLTNGPVDGQQRKIESLGLSHWFDYIQIGEKVGVFKPDRQAFEILLKTIQKSAEVVVMVGDSLHSDIEAAEKVGMATIHFNAHGDVSSLCELPPMISKLNQ